MTPAILYHGAGALCGMGLLCAFLWIAYGKKHLNQRDPLLIIYPIEIGGGLGWYLWPGAIGLSVLIVTLATLIYVAGMIKELIDLNRVIKTEIEGE